MKTTLILFIILGFVTTSKGQQEIVVKEKQNKTIADIDTLIGIRNKKIIFEYDTLFIINRYGVNEFVRCAQDLRKVKDLSGSLNNLSSDLSNIQIGVNDMHTNMTQLTDFINNYNKDTKNKLNDLNTDNAELSKKMDLITKDLEEARQKIKAERWKSLGTKLIWGIGGLAVGGLVFSFVK